MNKTYLLDTNIVSEFTKQKPDEKVISFYYARKHLCAISSVTWQELIFGVSKMPEGKRKNSIKVFLEQLKQNIDIVPYDETSAKICGNALCIFEKKGRPLPYNDAQIAATAISNGMVLVTHNKKDFSELEENLFLQMEDWFFD